MKRVLIVIGIVLGLVAVGLGTFFITNHFHNKETEQLTSQIAVLNGRLQDIGNIVTCYTVTTETRPGQEITADMLVEQSIPETLTNDSFAGIGDIVGLYSKTIISPGTPITKDMVMQDLIEPDTRELDIVAARWPTNLQVGDYVDVRLTYPRGEDFIVVSHKRVMAITQDSVKLSFNEDEIMLWQAAMVDWYTLEKNGADFWLSKYVEPGLQPAASPFYAVPVRVGTVCLLDPNIREEALAALVSVAERNRPAVDQAKEPFPEGSDTGGLINQGRTKLNQAIMGDYAKWKDEYEKYLENQQGTGEDSASDSLVQDITEGGLE